MAPIVFVNEQKYISHRKKGNWLLSVIFDVVYMRNSIRHQTVIEIRPSKTCIPYETMGVILIQFQLKMMCYHTMWTESKMAE